MTKEEFNRWWQTYKAAYPEAAAYLAERSDDGGKATLELWNEALDDVELDDAREVLRQMVRGDIAAVRAFERGETAAIIRKHAREISYRRTAKPEEAPWRVHTERTERVGRLGQGNAVQRDPVMRAALEEVLRMKEAGRPQAEIKQMLRERFPEDQNDRRDRVTCRICRDSGYATVWSQRAISACLNNELDDRKNRTTAAIPCSCDRGRVKIGVKSKDTGKDYWKRHFDMTKDCLCRDPDCEEAIEELKVWCDEKLNEKPANYTHSFDDYNRQHEEPF